MCDILYIPDGFWGVLPQLVSKTRLCGSAGDKRTKDIRNQGRDMELQMQSSSLYLKTSLRQTKNALLLQPGRQSLTGLMVRTDVLIMRQEMKQVW